MEELCYCSKKLLDPQHATYVVRGRPCCGRACYNMAIADDNRRLRYQPTRIVGSWQEGFHVR